MHIYDTTHDVYDETLTVIQYFYFYPYNDWWNKHEGDWQKINVVVSSSDPSSATFLGVEYFFHGAHLSYYKDYDSKPDITKNFVFNPREHVKLNQGTHPIVYVGAGSHAAYPTGGNWHIYRKAGGLLDKSEYMTHTGLVLRTQVEDSNRSLQENYDLVLLPEPKPSQANMGLPDTMSWLGAKVRWGTLTVNSGSFFQDIQAIAQGAVECPAGNKSPKGPYHKGWEELKFFTSSHTGGCGGTLEYGITHSAKYTTVI